MAEIVFEWEIQPKQIQFLDACGLAFPFTGEPGPKAPAADHIGYGGAAGGGKTDALLMCGIIACYSFKGINVGFFRRKFTELQGPGGAIMRSQELLHDKAKWNGSLYRWTFPGGATLTFCHLNDDNSVYAYQSQQFDIMLFDEQTQFTDYQIEYMVTRNRATKNTIIKPFSASATNPGGIGHARFKEQFVDIGEPGIPHVYVNEEGKKETRLFIQSFLHDNQALEKRDPSYREKLESRPDHLKRQLLDGDWDVAEGMAFPEWRKTIHVCEPFVIPESWIRIRSLDWGYAKPFSVGWYAIDHDGRMYKYREYYGWNGKKNEGCRMDPEHVAEEIIKKEQGEEIRYAVADSAIFGGKQDSGPDIAEKFNRAFGNRATHWRPVSKAPRDGLKSRVFGKMEFHYRLKWGKNEDGEWDGIRPMFVVFNNCVHTIRTIPNLTLDPDDAEDVDTEQEDHAYDETRYAFMSRPIMPRKEEQKKTHIQKHKEQMMKRHRHFRKRLT